MLPQLAAAGAVKAARACWLARVACDGAVFILSVNLSAAAVVALAFHCIPRVDEACGCRWGDLRAVQALTGATYAGIAGVMGISRPKVRSRPRHAPVQFALIEDDALMEWLHWLTCNLNEEELQMALWPGPTWSLRKWWDAAVSSLGCQ